MLSLTRPSVTAWQVINHSGGGGGGGGGAALLCNSLSVGPYLDIYVLLSELDKSQFHVFAAYMYFSMMFINLVFPTVVYNVY